MNTRKRIRTVLTLAVVAMATVIAGARQVDAASLIHVETILVSDNQSVYNVSVYPGKASYSALGGSVTGVFGNGTVADYRFSTANSDIVWSYADGGAGIVAPITSPPPENVSGNVSGSQHWARVWTTSDPGVNFANPADFTSNTQAGAQNITGTIDISRIGKGTLYFIYGSYEDINTITLTMSGPGQPDLTASHTEDPPANNLGWISSFDISNAGAYDRVTYTYTNNDADGSRARFMGVIVCADDPMFPYPSDGALVSAGEVELNWTNLPPIGDANDVWVDVWFGTDPVSDFGKVLNASINATSVKVNALVIGTTYYWQVNSYISGSPTGDPNEGNVYSFIAADLPPSAVDAGRDMITWSGGSVQLIPTVEDDGLSALSYAWTANAPAGVTVEFSNPAAPNPTVTVTKEAVTDDAAVVVLTLAVSDAANQTPAEGIMTIDVYDDACKAAIGAGLDPIEPTDLDGNCVTNLADYAAMALKWLDEYSLTEPVAKP